MSALIFLRLKRTKLGVGVIYGGEIMVDREKEWIEKISKVDKLAKAKSTTEEDRLHCLVQTSKGKIEVALYSELAPPLRIGDWAVVTVSPQRFVQWSAIFGKIIENAQKKP